jgi:hypothetical protein
MQYCIIKFESKEDVLSRISFVKSFEISIEQIESLAKLQLLSLSTEDLASTHQQFKLIASHAENVMTFPLDESFEPAPEFRP